MSQPLDAKAKPRNPRPRVPGAKRWKLRTVKNCATSFPYPMPCYPMPCRPTQSATPNSKPLRYKINLCALLIFWQCSQHKISPLLPQPLPCRCCHHFLTRTTHCCRHDPLVGHPCQGHHCQRQVTCGAWTQGAISTTTS